MSILIAYILIGLTFGAAMIAAHESVREDKWWYYLFVIPIVLMWPLVIYQATKTNYKYKYF